MPRTTAPSPEVTPPKHGLFHQLLARCAGLAPLVTAVGHPCDPISLARAGEAAPSGVISPILVGPEPKIRAAAAAAQLDISGYRIEATPHSHAAAARGVSLVRSGEAAMLMKGSLHTDELMHEVVMPDAGLRTARRISHAF